MHSLYVMTKGDFKFSLLDSKRLLRKLPNILRNTFLPHHIYVAKKSYERSSVHAINLTASTAVDGSLVYDGVARNNLCISECYCDYAATTDEFCRQRRLQRRRRASRLECTTPTHRCNMSRHVTSLPCATIITSAPLTDICTSRRPASWWVRSKMSPSINYSKQALWTHDSR